MKTLKTQRLVIMLGGRTVATFADEADLMKGTWFPGLCCQTNLAATGAESGSWISGRQERMQR